MNFYLSTPVFDLNGYLKLKGSDTSKSTEITRRVTRTKTLDGLNTIVDFGSSESDRTLDISIDEISASDLDNLKRMVITYPILVIAYKQGVFTGVIDQLIFDSKPLNFVFLVKKKLS